MCTMHSASFRILKNFDKIPVNIGNMSTGHDLDFN